MASNANTSAPRLPGRLGTPGLALRDDPRADPRMIAAGEPFGLAEIPPPAPVGASSTLDELLAFCAEAEGEYAELNANFTSGLPPVEGVSTETRSVTGLDGNAITLYVSRPTGTSEVLPGILHLHGGGMVLMQAADPLYERWRLELAATGLVVVGVEFRNGAGKLGPHPFPAGLNDCASSLYWMAEHKRDLGISGVVISGESGGGNLSLATALKAKRDGKLGDVAGVYAQCPFISNAYVEKDPKLLSLFENDEYGLSCAMMGTLSKLYDPTGKNASNPLAWPLHAGPSDLEGLPPHFVSAYQLDPIRDEGLAYVDKLLAAGVIASSRTINGLNHAADMIFRKAMPEIYLASVRDIKGFADSVCGG